MIASLYQSASGNAATVRLSSPNFEIIRILQEVVEISLRTQPSPYFEDMRRQYQRIQFDVVPGALPQVPRVGQQVVYLEGLLRGKLEIREGKLDPTRLFVTRVQIHNYENDVG